MLVVLRRKIKLGRVQGGRVCIHVCIHSCVFYNVDTMVRKGLAEKIFE